MLNITENVALQEAEIKRIVDDIMCDVSLVAQSIVNKIDFPDESAKARFYVNIVTQIADYVSNMIPQLNKEGIENIIKEYGIEIPFWGEKK